MTRSRIHTIFLVLACFVLASVPSHALQLNGHPMPDIHPKRSLDLNSPRMQEARKEALAESRGEVTPLSENNGGWTSKYSLYVGCTTSPAGKTYSTIQAAVAVALPYTTIYVCPGQYAAGGGNTGITLTTSYIEIKGVSPYQGAETVSCETVTHPDDGSYGFYLEGSYDHVKNLTINDCEYGVVEGYSEVRDEEVSFSFFNDDYYGVYAYYCDKCEVEDSKFQTNYYAIYTEYDVKDSVTGNDILGDGASTDVGIYLVYGIDAQVVSNTASSNSIGLELNAVNDFATVTSNHFDGNVGGVILYDDNSGNTFTSNYVNGNSELGFAVINDDNGVVATPDSGPNRFLSNHAFGNGSYDYYDATVGYTGNDSSTNAGTADYYKGNRGNNAIPGAILFQ